MTREDFMNLCEIAKFPGETARDAWIHIAAVRVADQGELNFQKLIKNNECYFYDGNGMCGFFTLGPLNPAISIEHRYVWSFTSVENFVAVSFLPRTNITNIESFITEYFPGYPINTTVTFDRSNYTIIIPRDKNFASCSDFVKEIKVKRVDTVSEVLKLYETSAERDAGTLNDTVGKVINRDMQVVTRGTYYLRVFGGNSGTSHDDATVTIK